VRSSRTTSEFLEQQMGELKTQLDAAEKKVAEFKSAHIGTLPEEMESNQRNLDRLQRDLSSVSEQVTAAEDRRVLLETQMAKLQGELFASGSGDMVTLEQQIESLDAQLNQALQTLTPEHPDVKALKAKIAQLRAQMGTQEMVGGRQYRVNAVNRALFEQLQATIRNIQSLNAQRGHIQGQIAALNGRVSLSPQVEQELSALTRDYDKLREAYQDLQKKHMEAQQAAELEAQQKGRQFKIIDPARFPEKPYKPNRPRLVALAMVIGLFLGLMAIFVTEHLDHSFRDDEDLARFAGKPVLTTIPRFSLQSDAERRTRLFRLGLAAVAAGGFLLLLVVILRFGFGIHLW
jgi:polysaccharide chain length determinant protein (PEP-CTERM system associated)